MQHFVQLLGLPFLACAVMTAILGYLGIHVLKREIVFVDIAMAQVVAEEKRQKRRSRSAPFEENDRVEIVGGLFAGQKGVVTGYDQAGKIKVKVGNLTLPVNPGALKRLST